MKYIKTFEDNKLIGYQDLIPGYMYKDATTVNETIVCFIGNNNTTYPLLCLIFNDNNQKNFYFIEWTKYMKFIPLNIPINEYIIENSIVSKTMKSLKKHNFSGTPTGNSLKMILDLRSELLKDVNISVYIDSEKFNI